MYRIEIEKADGNCFFYGQPHLTEEEWATLDELSDGEKLIYVWDVLLVKGK